MNRVFLTLMERRTGDNQFSMGSTLTSGRIRTLAHAAALRAFSCCCCAPMSPTTAVPTRESMCVGPPSCMRERTQYTCHARESTSHMPQCKREGSQHAYPNARGSSACAPMQERREHNAHAHVLSWLHAPPWGTTLVV
jgi:hypothetical protein